MKEAEKKLLYLLHETVPMRKFIHETERMGIRVSTGIGEYLTYTLHWVQHRNNRITLVSDFVEVRYSQLLSGKPIEKFISKGCQNTSLDIFEN